MQFNYSLSWHVVVMKEAVLNINRAKLTSPDGLQKRETYSKLHLHIKQCFVANFSKGRNVSSSYTVPLHLK